MKKGMTTNMAERFESLYKTKLQAGAFRMLCIHLNERSEEVQDIDLKTVIGFDRSDLSMVRPQYRQD